MDGKSFAQQQAARWRGRAGERGGAGAQVARGYRRPHPVNWGEGLRALVSACMAQEAEDRPSAAEVIASTSTATFSHQPLDSQLMVPSYGLYAADEWQQCRLALNCPLSEFLSKLDYDGSVLSGADSSVTSVLFAHMRCMQRPGN